MASTAGELHRPGAGAPPSEFETATYKKVAWRLSPLLLICYVVAYLDRVNVGFAKLQMSTDLGLSDAVYGFGAGIFFFGYFIFEIPSNVILHKVGARVWIARIMITWGIISALTMFITTPTMFYVMRFMLGVAEAGFFPGIILYLTYWFPAERRGRMTTLFMTAIALSGLIGGPVSGWIMKNFDGVNGWHSWQWLFLLEGIPSVVVGIVVFGRPDGECQVAHGRGAGAAGEEHRERQCREGRYARAGGAQERTRVVDEPYLLFVRDGTLRRELLAADDHQGNWGEGCMDHRLAFRDSVWRGGDRDAAGCAQCR